MSLPDDLNKHIFTYLIIEKCTYCKKTFYKTSNLQYPFVCSHKCFFLFSFLNVDFIINFFLWVFIFFEFKVYRLFGS